MNDKGEIQKGEEEKRIKRDEMVESDEERIGSDENSDENSEMIELEYEKVRPRKVKENNKKQKKEEKCGHCKYLFKDGHLAISCDNCFKWYHLHCSNISLEVFNFYKDMEMEDFGFKWICVYCSESQQKDESIQTIFKGYSPYASCSSNVSFIENKENNKKIKKYDEEKIKKSKKTLEKINKNIANSSIAAAQFVPVNNTVHPDAANIVNTATAGKNEQNVQYGFNPPVCKYYQKGICRHGSSGKTLWNGLTCKFSHPKKCNKFCKYGYHPLMGCHDKQCKFMHPICVEILLIKRGAYSPTVYFSIYMALKDQTELE